VLRATFIGTFSSSLLNWLFIIGAFYVDRDEHGFVHYVENGMMCSLGSLKKLWYIQFGSSKFLLMVVAMIPSRRSNAWL
jgi:hypothetical protein